MSVGVAIVALSIGGVLAQEDTTDDGDSSSGGGSVGTTILSYVTIGVLIAASGLFSGLTLGLLGLDKIGLEIIGNGDEPRMAAFAKVGGFPLRGLVCCVDGLRAAHDGCVRAEFGFLYDRTCENVMKCPGARFRGARA